MPLPTSFRLLAQAQLLLLCVDLVLGLRTRDETQIIGKPSVVIAGIGDSGTTAVTKALESLGMEHCRQRDSFEEPPWGHALRKELVTSFLKAGRGEMSSRVFKRNATAFVEAQAWLSYVAYKDHRCIIEQRLNASQSVGRETRDLVWGFKEPHYIWLLPAMDEAFRNKTRYLLVARDPRDVCTNAVQDQFKFYRDLVNTYDCFDFWAKLWMRLLEAYERDPRFAIVRIEDLVMPDPKVSEDSLRTLACAAEHVGMRAPWARLHHAVTDMRAGTDSASTWQLFSRDNTRPATATRTGGDSPKTGQLFSRDNATLVISTGPQYASELQALQQVHDFHRHNGSYMGHHHDTNSSFRERLVNWTAQNASRMVRATMLRLGYDPHAFRLLKPKTRSCLCHHA